MSFYGTLMKFLLSPEGTHGVLSVGVSLALTGCVYAALSRLLFHPLAKVPGPKLAALSDLYVTYWDVVKDGQFVQHLQELHSQYGPVVRIGPNKLHFADQNAYDAIYRDPRFPKEAWFYDAFFIPESSFGSSDIQAAKHHGNLVRGFFSRKSVLKLEDVIQDVIDRFVSIMAAKAHAQDIVNFHRAFASITMEVITTYCFDKNFNTVSYPDFAHPAMVGFHESGFAVVLMRHFPFIRSILFNMPIWLTRRLSPGAMGRITFIKALESQIAGILEDKGSLDQAEHEIIYHHLLNPKNEGEELSRASLRDHAMSLVVGGTETVANTCVMATYHVLANSHIKERLKQELEKAWPDANAPMSLERLEKLPYLTAVIKEALRKSHGVVYPAPRIVKETTHIGGVVVPANTVVGMGQPFVHLNPDVFPNPSKFEPERWLVDDVRMLDNHLVPFSRGPRSCLGINLAWAELYLILGNLFRKVDLELAGTKENDLDFKAYFIVNYRGLPLAKVLGVQGVNKVDE